MDNLSQRSVSDEAAFAIELAALVLGRVGGAVGEAGSAISGALVRRQVARAIGGGEEALRSLLLGESADSTDRLRRFHAALTKDRAGARDAADDVLEALASAGLGGAARPPAASALHDAMSPVPRRPVLTRAAISAGILTSGAPGSRDALAAAALCAERIFMAGGLTHSAWAAPTQHDAATRASAVQLERTGDWDEWTRAWCLLVVREGTATDKALRAVRERMSRESEEARARHRVGATDAVVLARLHSRSVFTIPDAIEPLGLSAPTIGTAIERLEGMGFAFELTGQRRDRVWTSTALLSLSLTP